MVLESLKSDGQININHLVIESPRKPEVELPFDPKRDITEKDLRIMDERAKADVKQNGYGQVAAVICGSLKLLFPNRPLPVNVNNLSKFESYSNYIGPVFRSLKIVNPQAQIKDYGNGLQGWFDELQYKVQKDWDSDYKTVSFRDLAEIKMFKPEGIADILTDKRLKEIFFLRSSEKKSVIKDWYYSGIAADAKIVLEDDFDFKLSAEDWQRYQEILELQRAINSWFSFAQFAGDMTILAAEKVRVIPNEGLVLTMPQRKPDFRQHIPPLPQMRRF